MNCKVQGAGAERRARLMLEAHPPVATTKEIWRFFDGKPQAEIVVLGFPPAEKASKNSGLIEVKECQRHTPLQPILDLRGSTVIRT